MFVGSKSRYKRVLKKYIESEPSRSSFLGASLRGGHNLQVSASRVLHGT